MNELSIDDATEISKEDVDDTKPQTESQTDMDSTENHRSVSVIMQELQKELERPVMEVRFLFFTSFCDYSLLA